MGLILVATDGSPTARAAVDAAIETAHAAGDTLLFVTAWRELRGDFGLPYETLLAPDIADVERTWAEETVAEAAARAREAGVEAETACRRGKPVAVISELAREREPRMIVIGSHGWSLLERVVFGSVSTGVLHNARCSVLVVPTPS